MSSSLQGPEGSLKIGLLSREFLLQKTEGTFPFPVDGSLDVSDLGDRINEIVTISADFFTLFVQIIEKPRPFSFLADILCCPIRCLSCDGGIFKSYTHSVDYVATAKWVERGAEKSMVIRDKALEALLNSDLNRIRDTTLTISFKAASLREGGA